ncbi:MAG: hypothetical protein AB1757_09620 [Acidobacteriota bacterium]
MKQVRLIKRDERPEEKPVVEEVGKPDHSKINLMMNTVREWVEKNRSTQAKSPRKQFSALFSG